jgi:hypothetical protein
MRKNAFHSLLARLLPLAVVLGLCLAAPAYAGSEDGNSQGSDDQGGGSPRYQGHTGPAIPEPSGWLAMGVGLLVAAPYLRSRGRRE